LRSCPQHAFQLGSAGFVVIRPALARASQLATVTPGCRRTETNETRTGARENAVRAGQRLVRPGAQSASVRTQHLPNHRPGAEPARTSCPVTDRGSPCPPRPTPHPHPPALCARVEPGMTANACGRGRELITAVRRYGAVNRSDDRGDRIWIEQLIGRTDVSAACRPVRRAMVPAPYDRPNQVPSLGDGAVRSRSTRHGKQLGVRGVIR
jgi:hypothetical protein